MIITDWQKLGIAIGSIHENGESGGDNYAEIALETILGQEWIETTVEHILSFKKGSEVAMNCLRSLRSKQAVLYAYRIYKKVDGEKAARALWLIKHIAHPVSFKWIEEFLNDDNVMDWGIGVLDQLLWSKQISYNREVEFLLKKAVEKSELLRPRVQFIRKYLEEPDYKSNLILMTDRINISSAAIWENKVGYSRAVKVGAHIEVSGTVASDEAGNVVGRDDAYAQTKYILQKIETALQKAGSSLTDVVRTRMFVTDISRFDEYAKAHGEAFAVIKPCTSMLEVKALVSPEYLIEIEATAILAG